MKAHCNNNGSFKGKIPDIETYEKLKVGQVFWKPHIRQKLDTIEIPFEHFEYLMNLDKERESNV